MTGGTGFVGSHVVEQLLGQGFKVQCLVRPSRSNPGWLEGTAAEIIKVDLTSIEALKPVLRDSEYIFHIAGTTKVRRKEEYYTGNVLTTRAILAAARENSKLKKICHISSLSAVGPSLDGSSPDETTPCKPVSLYGQTKYEAEQVVASFADDIPSVILRPPTVYGPRDTDVLEMYQWTSRGIMPIIGKEEKTLSMIHVSDLARGIIEATLSNKSTGKTYFIANEPIYTYSRIVKLLTEIQHKKKALMVKFPDFGVKALAAVTEIGSKFASRPNILNSDKVNEILQPHWICDPRKIKEELGFVTNISLEEGLRTTFEWYKAHKWL
ncbi:MAG: NAD-dependent epimerase/dehydratase family protein [Ignavibacteriae bacterium]|nr:NAD-dependent epimerase/dehydratase family protein [Ignavibacteriota bacterium]